MSNILLVSLWLTPDKLSSEVLKKVAGVHVAYSADAVNHIIKTLYEVYTHVDTVIVYGPDFRNVGDLIISALRGKCNEAVRIPCRYVENLNLHVVDMRWKSEAELREALDMYKAYRAPVRQSAHVELEIPNRRHPQRGPHVIYDTDLEILRIKAIDYLLTYGVETRDVIYSVIMLQVGEGSYTTSTCDLVREWPCGLDRYAVLLAAPAYVQRGEKLPEIPVEIYKRDVYDPRGNFYLGDKLYHYSPAGVLLRVIDITDAQVEREASKLLPDHAFYLGQEYAAYKLLRDRYIQDKWR